MIALEEAAAGEAVAKALTLAQHLPLLLVVQIALHGHILFIIENTFARVVFLDLLLALVLLDLARASACVDLLAHFANSALLFLAPAAT